MILRREMPHFRAVTRDDTPWGLPDESYEEFLAAWMRGEAFWRGIDLWDQPITIKLATIVAVVRKTEHSLALGDAEEQEERQRALLHGKET